ncbi:MAG: zinc ribbon domain-containing protein [Vagococcus sp.]
MWCGRTSKLRKDGTRKRTAYYVCGAFKNKGSSVCRANGIRADKVNEVVFEKLSEFMSNERIIKTVVGNVNQDIKEKVTPAKKQMSKLEKDLTALALKKQKAIEVYEEGIINKEELSIRIEKFRKDEEQLQNQLYSYKVDLQDGEGEAIPYEVVKEMMGNFRQLLEVAETQEQRKKLLHMMIDKITINQNKELDSIQIKINDDVINYIAHSEEVSNKDTSSFYVHQNLWGRGIKLKIMI